ncbi:MAG: aldo/keto reductase, partial [Candidatus Glassbacteria bacterium]
MDRRNFLSHGMLAAGGLSLAACKSTSAQSPGPGEKKPPMKYRTLGRTGLVVSEVAFGTYGWQNTAVLVNALEAGVSLICTCADYQSGAAERAVGLAIKGRREKISLLSGIDCPRDPGESEMLERLEASLERLGTGWLDIYVPHQADTVANVTNPAIPKAFEKMKAKGKARWLGISTHSGQLEPMLERAIDLGYYDVLLCRYNFMEYKSQMKIFARAAEAGIGVIVFKVHAG